MTDNRAIVLDQSGEAPGFACRFCRAALHTTFVDLGMSPLCQTHIRPDQLHEMEPFYPLHAYVCDQCFLVQLQEFVTPDEIFTEYAYFSSYSSSWVEHARRYTESMVERFGLDSRQPGDGDRQQRRVSAAAFRAARTFPCSASSRLQTSPRSAIEKGIPTTIRFLGRESASDIAAKHGKADLLLGNNVLAHVPDINDFVAGMKQLLAPTGVITMEFPHLARLIDESQFDTIYHEHFSYLSFAVVGADLRASRHYPVRRRGATDARRFAANLRATRRVSGTRGFWTE